MAYARARDPSPWPGPICHHVAMSNVQTPVARETTAPKPRHRRSLDQLASGPRRDTALAGRILAEDDKRLTVSGFNSSV